jgi:hypothetical protein
MRKSVNQMVAALKRRVCIRDIWNCRAGWGMKFILQPGVNDKLLEYHKHAVDRADDGCVPMVYAYFPTLEECVRREYNWWVLGKSTKGHPDPDLRS